MKLKKLFKTGYISIEYVIIAALIFMITAAGAPRIYERATDMTHKKADSVNSYIYLINTSSENITATGGKRPTNTVPAPEIPIDPGDGTVIPNPDDGLIHPTSVSLWVDAQATGGPISETTDPIDITLYPGQQIRVNGRVLPINANNLAIRWVNYNTDVATANQNGLITAINPGDALIRVEAIDNGAFNEINVHVRHIVPADFDIVPDKLTMTVDDVEEVFVKFEPENVTLKQCTFTSQNTALVSVEQNTTTSAIFTAVNAEKNNNKTTVTVVCQSQNATEEPIEITKNIEVEVLGKMVNTESIELKDEEITLEVGDTYQIQATVLPSDASVKELDYESLNDDVANVNVSGLVSAVAVGETYIYVRNYGGDYYGKEIFTAMKVTVKPKTIAITGVDIEYAHSDLPAGQVMSPTVSFTPETTTQTDLIWTSSNPSILKVGSNGQVQGVTEGTATVTATSAFNSSVKDSYTITVTGRIDRVTGIELSAETTTVLVNDMIVITAEVKPETAFNKNVSWTSNNSSVCVVNNGMVTGISAGVCVITAKTEDGDFTDSIEITVTEIAVTDITITPTNAKIGIGDVVQLEATVYPANATRSEIAWSFYELSTGVQQENIIILDNGIVTGVGYGTVVVRATASNGDFAESTITVAEVIPTSIEMPEKIILNKGASYPIEAKVLPENSVSKALTWSSENQNLVTVDQSGIVTASSVFYGTTTITATWSNGEHTVIGSTIVEVLPTMPDLITFNPESYTVQVDASVNGTLTVLPITTDYHTVTYSISDPTIFSIEDKGLAADGITSEFVIKGLKIGTAKLIATTENGIIGEAEVTVTTNEIFAESIYSDNSIIEIEVGETFTPTIKFNPETTTNKELKWETEDALIATVSSSGVITGVSEGTTYVNVQSVSNGSWYKFTVIVSGLQPQTLTVSPSIMELYKLTETMNYEITILPNDSIDTGYYYEVYNNLGERIPDEDVTNYLIVLMTDSKNGKITGRKVGDYTVRFIVNGYPDIYDEINVSVVSSPWDGNVFIDTDMTIENNTCYPEDGWQLAWIAHQANLGTLDNYCKIVSQQADIDLNHYPWTPMGINDEAFSATYMGNGHTVKNIYITGEDIFDILKDGQTDVVYDYGLFGKMPNQIMNLNIDGVTIDYTGIGLVNPTEDTKIFIGGLAGQAKLLSKIDVENGNIVINTTTSETIYSGSIAGIIGIEVPEVLGDYEQDEHGFFYEAKYSGYNYNEEFGAIGEHSFIMHKDGTVDYCIDNVIVQTFPWTYDGTYVNIEGMGFSCMAVNGGKGSQVLQTGSVYILGDSVYEEDGLKYVYMPDVQIWYVEATDFDKSTYEIKTEINGNAITGLQPGAFEDCSIIKNLTIPEGITHIQGNSFSGSLETINLPSTIEYINEFAFSSATSLTDIYYNGTADEWAAIAGGVESIEAVTIHFKDGTISWTHKTDNRNIYAGYGNWNHVEVYDHRSNNDPSTPFKVTKATISYVLGADAYQGNSTNPNAHLYVDILKYTSPTDYVVIGSYDHEDARSYSNSKTFTFSEPELCYGFGVKITLNNVNYAGFSYTVDMVLNDYYSK